MTSRFSRNDWSSWEGLLGFLGAELDCASSAARRALLLESMAFVESDGLGRNDDALSSLGQVLGLVPGRARALWDTWRLAAGLGLTEQAEILSQLAALSEPAADGEQRFLRHARFQRDSLGRAHQAEVLIGQARAQWPAGQHSLLAEAEAHLLSGSHADAATALERLARSTDDASLRASLRVEAAWLRKESGADDDVALLLEEALVEPLSDWMFIRDTLDLSAEIGDWVLHEASLRRMASAAMEDVNPPDGQWPTGHEFDGFERGASVAAAYWWFVAVVRERRLGRLQSAAEALEHALEFCPGHPLLRSEHARLIEALGRFEDAFASLPQEASRARRAELLLLAGRTKEAAQQLQQDTRDGVVERVLRDLLGATSPPADPEALSAWLRAHPDHAEAPAAAVRLLEQRDDPVAHLLVSEARQENALWPPVSSHLPIPAWQLASEAMKAIAGKGDADPRTALLAWAEVCVDATLRAVLCSVAARILEDEGDPVGALNLYEESQSLSPQTPAAKLATMRLLQRLERYTDLVTRLTDHAATSGNPFNARAMLHQAGHVTRFKLGDVASAEWIFDDLCRGDPTDVPALWTAFELAFEVQDMLRAIDVLGQIAQQCPGDAEWLQLLAAEIELLVTKDYSDALVHLAKVTDSNNESIARSARLYRMLALYQLEDITSLDEALQEEALVSQGGLDRMWIPELLEAGRGARGAEAMAELLEADGDSSPVKLLWLLLVGAMSGETSKLVSGLRALARGAPPGEIAGACRVAALLFDPKTDLDQEENLSDADLESAEVLLHVADCLAPSTLPERRADIALQRAELCREYDLAEWADWRLEAIEAFEDLGQLVRSLSLVRESLAELPDHPGLLEAYARVADLSKDYEASFDAHQQLAGFYVEPGERSHQLVQSARIAMWQLARPQDALRLAEQAMEADPESAEAFGALTAAQKLVGDNAGVLHTIERQLDVASGKDEQLRLLRELADQQLSLDDTDGCLATIDRLLMVDPSRADALRTKIEILAEAGRSVEQLQAMDVFIEVESDLVEARKMAWRASDFLAQRGSDRSGAIERLRAIERRNDTHPDTQRRLISLLELEHRWDEAADALHKLASFVTDKAKRLDTLYEEARVRLEQLFDDSGASRILDEILDDQPLHLPSLELADTFRPRETNLTVLDRAAQVGFATLSENPTDLACIGQLAEVARLADQADVRRVCDEAVAFLSKVEPVSILEFVARPNPGRAAQLWPHLQLSHYDHAAAVVATIAANACAEAFSGAARSLQLGRSTRLNHRGVSPLRDWLEEWAVALGYGEPEFHAAGDSPEGSLCLPGAIPTIVVCGDPARQPSAEDRYFAVFNLVRSAQGLGAFAVADHAGPQRWVLAVAASVLGESTPLPVPTDKELVNRAKKGLSRKVRAQLEEPSQRLVQQTATSLRAWSAEAISTADRAGLLAAGHLYQTMHSLIGQEAGTTGAQMVISDPQRQLPRLPRGKDLLSFALGGQLIRSRRLVLGDQGGEGGGQ